MDREDIVELASKTTVPEWVAGAHWAANGMCFYTGDQFPEEVKGDAFIAYHGSWNSSVKVGYCVTRILFEDGHPFGELKYVNFLTDEEEVRDVRWTARSPRMVLFSSATTTAIWYIACRTKINTE